MLTLGPHGRTYYIPNQTHLPSRASTPPAGYASDPESELHKVERAADNLAGQSSISHSSRRRRRKGTDLTDSKDAAKTATWPDLFQLATLQALIYDNETSLSTISSKVDHFVAEDHLSPLKRDISERQNRISELKLNQQNVLESCSKRREAIEARAQLLRSRREMLFEARDSIEEAEDAEVAIADKVANERSQSASLRLTMTSMRSNLISILADIFPIELYSPPDLIFTILDVALPLPLSTNDPAPPLSVPEHKDINEDSIATALGYVAQVLQILAAYLGTNLLYPVTCIGSRSLIRDGISAMIGPRMFPLYSKGVDTYRFEYGVFLLNKNVEMASTVGIAGVAKTVPPAFLDLADSAARLGSNMPDMSARVELKRLEHERQRAIQRKMFEDHMKVLEHQQAQELLSIPYDPTLSGQGQHIALSAPTTPPGTNKKLGDVRTMSTQDKRKSVTYAPTVNLSPDLRTGAATNGNGFGRPAGAKSMPASRRTSASSHDEDLAAHIQGLSLAGDRSARASPIPAAVSASILLRGGGRFGDDEGARYASTYNAGLMLDEQLDQEMHSAYSRNPLLERSNKAFMGYEDAMRNLPTSDDDKFHHAYNGKLTASNAALDLAHVSQTSPRTHFSNRVLDTREQSSEWPQFTGVPRGPDGMARSERRTVTNPNLTLSTPTDETGTGILSASPIVQHMPQGQLPLSRRASPPNMLDGLAPNTRSVPATPLGLPGSASHLLKTPGTPLTPDLQASLSRIPSTGPPDAGSLVYNSLSSGRDNYDLDSFGLPNAPDNNPYAAYGYEGPRGSINLGNSIIPSNGGGMYAGSPRYGAGMGGRGGGPVDGKMNGLHGPKHKRGDIDREYNRFAGIRLEDLQGEIAGLCKDQHGCRYLQKKLEEGAPEHRDMIFRETFSHFPELMTDPFGNYLCQKLLEYATDDQRNLICESVAQDLVNISLNMHGTRAVQKMIDFLSTRRQTDLRYNAQINSIIVALSLHVVVLIKDLNGNHVIQKCLNKLAPEDNQASEPLLFATHRHGCCVLQRCIDHAAENQRVQLVNEITFNALTLVQDPYGNYVVQYILDLNDNRFSDAVIRQFLGNICALSVQKFSSNVIEKCVRVAEHNTRKLVIDELLNRSRLEKLLRDSYGNYCVQTALDYADPAQRALLVEGIRPVLPLIRNTPYGKRIQNKLQRIANAQGGGGRHLNQNLSNNNLNEMYNAPAGLYSMPQAQPGFGQSPLAPQLHGLQGQSIDSYILQNSAGHNPLLGPTHPNPFAGATFPNISPFAGVNLGGAMNDPYQRSGFAYGM
ncbi:hypothetical protein EST38_g7413 [Candolleomyces aberdarensis]|uniref:Autophagy-related protein 14 n=1 Tax=Candolleomyces aberdarensis TaxID=2316362 RepID=A0A4Q2DI25_9AGAR|nr:hypothetical protein EST38_g7413 [Candolleomyces aberdarensis]